MMKLYALVERSSQGGIRHAQWFKTRAEAMEEAWVLYGVPENEHVIVEENEYTEEQGTELLRFGRQKEEP